MNYSKLAQAIDNLFIEQAIAEGRKSEVEDELDSADNQSERTNHVGNASKCEQ